MKMLGVIHMLFRLNRWNTFKNKKSSLPNRPIKKLQRRIRKEVLINTSISRNRKNLPLLIPIRSFSLKRKKRSHQAQKIMLKSKNFLSWKINNPSPKKKNHRRSKEKSHKNLPFRVSRKNKTFKILMNSLRSNKNLSRRSRKKKSTKRLSTLNSPSCNV